MGDSNGSKLSFSTELQTPKALARSSRQQTIASYEHPIVVRLCHWLIALALILMTASGLEIFRAFPSFGNKIPAKDLLIVPSQVTLGGWLGGALQWHFTFMWLFVGGGVLYVTYQLASGHYRQILFNYPDVRGLVPMVRYYLFVGPKPTVTGAYNPLQKLAYTSVIGLGALAVVSGLALYKPVQLYWLVDLLGGFRFARIWHFGAMCGLLAFLPGHLLMVALHGWNNFFSMITGWKRDPDYGMANAGRPKRE
jgi:thiosulfate reductase cytochrome b subunit